jgi:hypothetical protein
VAVVWPLVLPGARAVLGDLVVTHSVVVGVVNGTGTAAVYVGGGGLLVFGGGSGAVVEVSGCRFVNTSVVVSNPAKEGAAQVYGGAVFVGLVTAVDLVGGSVSVRDVASTGTSISCNMCQRTFSFSMHNVGLWSPIRVGLSLTMVDVCRVQWWRVWLRRGRFRGYPRRWHHGRHCELHRGNGGCCGE